MHLQLVGAEADQTMHLEAMGVGFRSTCRAQARVAVRAGSVLDLTRKNRVFTARETLEYGIVLSKKGRKRCGYQGVV